MSDLLLLSKKQVRPIRPYLPRSHGVPRVGGRRIILKLAVPHQATLYRRRHGIEKMLGCIKAGAAFTPADRCAHASMSATALAATVIFWIDEPGAW